MTSSTCAAWLSLTSTMQCSCTGHRALSDLSQHGRTTLHRLHRICRCPEPSMISYSWLRSSNKSHRLTDDMTNFERTYNLISYLKSIYVHQHVIHPRIDAVVQVLVTIPGHRLDSCLQRHYKNAASAFVMERNASLNFVNTPPIFDFARPYMPRVVFVGCIHCRNATVLPSVSLSFIVHE